MRRIALFMALVLIFTIPWETAITISSLGTLTKLIGFCAAGAWSASVLISRKIRKFHAYHLAVFLFMLFNLASIYWTFSIENTIIRIKTYLQLAILTWMLWDLIATPETLRMAMQVFIYGAYIIIFSQLSNLSAGQTIDLYDQGRFSGAGQNAVEFALILSLAMPLAWHLATTQKPGAGSRILKVINFAFIPMAFLSTILTASRTSLITNIPVLIYIAITLNKIKPIYRILLFSIVVIAFMVVWPLIPPATFERLSTIGNSISESDLGGRVRLWKASLAIFQEHPVIGVGANTLDSPDLIGAVAHNTFLSILAELGMVGMVLFLSIISIVVFQAIKQPAQYSILWITIIAALLIGIFSLTWEYTKVIWFFLTLVIISAEVHKPHNRSNVTPTIAISSFVDSNKQATVSKSL